MPTFSVIIPTLNAERALVECLENLTNQNYPREQYEIIIADGGSIDKTLEIARRYNAVIVSNPLKTAEAGKMAALKSSQGKYIASIDSDNVIIDHDWFTKMQKPLDQDASIVASEPIHYVCRPNDNPFVRYFAYLGMGDPFNLFLGNYDRICAITNRWTSLKIRSEEQKDGYLKIKLVQNDPLPTIGANGFVFRRELLTNLFDKEYLFDVDVLNSLMREGQGSCFIAKVDTGIIHLFVTNLKTLRRKLRRKVKDYVYYQSINQRVTTEVKNPLLKVLYPGGPSFWGLIFFVLSCLTIIPLLVQMIIGFIRKPDWVWIYHPLICEIALYIYSTERIKSFFKKEIYDRSQWSQ